MDPHSPGVRCVPFQVLNPYVKISKFAFLTFFLISSVDMHNQYEWQHMLPEALAIVCRCHKFISVQFPLLISFISSIKFDKTGFLSLTEAGLQEIGRCDQVNPIYLLQNQLF